MFLVDEFQVPGEKSRIFRWPQNCGNTMMVVDNHYSVLNAGSKKRGYYM